MARPTRSWVWAVVCATTPQWSARAVAASLEVVAPSVAPPEAGPAVASRGLELQAR